MSSKILYVIILIADLNLIVELFSESISYEDGHQSVLFFMASW